MSNKKEKEVPKEHIIYSENDKVEAWFTNAPIDYQELYLDEQLQEVLIREEPRHLQAD